MGIYQTNIFKANQPLYRYGHPEYKRDNNALAIYLYAKNRAYCLNTIHNVT